MGHAFSCLELVEGQTLADRLKRGWLPIDEALTIAKDICEAIEAAHEKGIIHRDLKPANIKITSDGIVKVLDFGLAKVREAEAQASDLSNSPTLMTARSVPGIILGTAAYMSPEQAKGQEANRTSDVWAFGCVLYEMLTGRPPFEGETVSELFAGILKADPDWNRLPAETPEHIVFAHKPLRGVPAQQLTFHDIAEFFVNVRAPCWQDRRLGARSPHNQWHPLVNQLWKLADPERDASSPWQKCRDCPELTSKPFRIDRRFSPTGVLPQAASSEIKIRAILDCLKTSAAINEDT